jgi:hypothetical protein
VTTLAHEVGIDNGLVLNAFGDIERTVVMSVEILFLEMLYFGKSHFILF